MSTLFGEPPPKSTEVQLITWDFNPENAARLVRKHNTLGPKPLYVCAGAGVYKRLFESILYVRL